MRIMSLITRTATRAALSAVSTAPAKVAASHGE
jgi:hypothetical protein